MITVFCWPSKYAEYANGREKLNGNQWEIERERENWMGCWRNSWKLSFVRYRHVVEQQALGVGPLNRIRNRFWKTKTKSTHTHTKHIVSVFAYFAWDSDFFVRSLDCFCIFPFHSDHFESWSLTIPNESFQWQFNSIYNAVIVAIYE